MRTIQADALRQAVAEMVVEANLRIPKPVAEAIQEAIQEGQPEAPQENRCKTLSERPQANHNLPSSDSTGKSDWVLEQIRENHRIAKERSLPLCQDTGVIIVFLDIGEELHIEGSLEEAIQSGIAQGTQEGNLRASMVTDPLERVNSKNNTPGIIHIRSVPGDGCTIHLMPKGGGSENKSTLTMIHPAAGWNGVKEVVLHTVRAAGSSACPPYIIGVGIGGSYEKAPLLAKEALLRDPGSPGVSKKYKALEEELKAELNQLAIGPAGAGEGVTVLDLFINPYPCHIATLPVAVNICCHLHRHVSRSL